ncbi:UNVERIFIED_CONTAM: hypothetical protein PYX00_000679 [Menopon gallinae]|uniref:Uncharacterized protein n=1 Tax=Menopon gallinae TaxID=328185 RepID=A0AAW2I9I3_9NEOP
MKICGPKCSICGLVISVWGIVQLVFMGIFYYVESVALVEDLPINENKPITNEEEMNEFLSNVQAGYKENAINCWIAACLYILTLILSGYQFYVNSRSSLTM